MLVNDLDRKIYAEELAPRLPKKILDVHVHIFAKKDFPADFSFPPRSCSARFGGEFTISMWRELMKELLPEQEVHLNSFAMPHLLANRDHFPEGAGEGDYVNVLISPDDPAEIVEQRLDRAHAVGVKPYLNLAAAVFNKKANDVEVMDMVSKEQLEMLNRRKKSMTFHIPRSARFADPLNQKQMIELCENYPDIRIIFAHIGRAYFMRNIYESNLKEFVKYPNVYFDTAMLNHEGVIKYTLDNFPPERLLFGTDAPISLLRGKSVEINNQYAYLMGEDYEVGTSMVDTKGAIKFTTFFYEQLRTMVNVVPERYLSAVLFDNANNLLASIEK